MHYALIGYKCTKYFLYYLSYAVLQIGNELVEI